MSHERIKKTAEEVKEKLIYWGVFAGALIEAAIANMGREKVWEIKNETDQNGRKRPVVKLSGEK